MLDAYIRPIIDPPLNRIGKELGNYGITANQVTAVGFVTGVLTMLMIMTEQYHFAFFLIVLNRFCDGIDGAVARHCGLSDFGGFLDIVADFVIYAGIVFAFGIAKPESMTYAAFLMFSFIGPITSFLAYAIIASKRKVHTEKRGKKSFYHLGGICEGSETTAFLILFCLLPDAFNALALIFGILCWMTTIGRIWVAWIDFGMPEVKVSESVSFESIYKEQVEERESQAPQEP